MRPGTSILNRHPSWGFILRRPAIFLAFGMGSGLSRVMPGTAGTLAAVPIYLLLAQLPLTAYIALVLLSFLVGVRLCHVASRELGVHDHGGIVWDEFVGYWITMVAVPPSALTVLAGFVVFRLFDMVKPWPISLVDRKVHGGLGIMIDDVLAGLASAGVLHLGLHFWAL